MLLRRRIVVVCIVLALSALVVGGLLAARSGSEVVYIDANSGRLRTVRTQFLSERSHTSDTDFSRLVKTHGLDNTEKAWRLATTHTWGIARLVHPKWQSTIYGEAVEACRTFALAYELGDVPQDRVPHCLKLLLQCMQEGRPAAMNAIVKSCASTQEY